MKKRKARMGRPPVDNPRCVMLGVKVTRDEAKAIRGKAARAGVTVSDFILGKLREA